MDPGIIKTVAEVGGLGLAVLLLLIGKQFITRVMDESQSREERLMGFVSQWGGSLADIQRSLQAQIDRLDVQGAILCELQKAMTDMTGEHHERIDIAKR